MMLTTMAATAIITITAITIIEQDRWPAQLSFI